MTNFIFDIDGTLTDARQPIDKEFEKYLHELAGKYSCYICTGSDYPKVEEQLGIDLCNAFEGIFTCSGNQLIKQGKEVYKNTWQLTKEQQEFLLNQLDLIPYPEKTGKHLELRIGSANLSIPGRNANNDQRAAFVAWDKEHNPRPTLVELFNKIYPEQEAVVAGDTGIDIFQLGKSKEQILEHFDTTQEILFFGDRIHPSGNDWTLGIAVGRLPKGKIFPVDKWQTTFNILKESNLIP